MLAQQYNQINLVLSTVFSFLKTESLESDEQILITYFVMRPRYYCKHDVYFIFHDPRQADL